MWICTRCQHSNEESSGRCLHCGAPRHARRFGAGTPVITPSMPEQAGEYRPPRSHDTEGGRVFSGPVPEGNRSRADRTSPSPPPVGRGIAGWCLFAAGLLLAVCLPSLGLWLAWAQKQSWQGQAALLFLAGAASPLAEAILYWVLAGLGALLLSLAGLGALGMSRLLGRLPGRRDPV